MVYPILITSPQVARHLTNKKGRTVSTVRPFRLSCESVPYAACECRGIGSAAGSTSSSVFIFFSSGNTFFANSV
jgi:hypothetical protein